MTPTISALTTSLVRPVTRGDLPIEQAHAAITMAILQSNPPPELLADKLRIWRHILAMEIDRREVQRATVQGAIVRALRPMIDRRAPKNQLLAEAFNANEDHGSPLTESEVRQIAVSEVARSIRGNRYVRR
jgi:hypothetical protein